MARLILPVTTLLVAIVLAGCYTQLGHYTPRYPTGHPSYHHQDRNEQTESEEAEQTEVEVESELSEAEDEGYYGRRKPTGSHFAFYERPYDSAYFPPYRYYGGYYPLYPDYGYSSYYPYYSRYGYHYHYGHHGYRHYRHRYSKRPAKIGDLHFGRQRSRSYRGVRSGQPSSRRLGKPSMKSESSQSPARRSSESQSDRSRRSGRR